MVAQTPPPTPKIDWTAFTWDRRNFNSSHPSYLQTLKTQQALIESARATRKW